MDHMCTSKASTHALIKKPHYSFCTCQTHITKKSDDATGAAIQSRRLVESRTKYAITGSIM